MSPTLEQVLAQAKDAMQAAEGLKEFKTKAEGKLDALDVDKINGAVKTITEAAEKSQTFQAGLDAEKKAREAFETAKEAELKTLRESGEASAKEIAELKAALERPGFAADQAKEAAEKDKTLRTKAFNEFARMDSDERVGFETFLKSRPEYKDLSVGSQPDGGYFVLPTILATVTSRLFETSALRQVADQITIGTDAVEFVTDDDELAFGGWVGETEARPNTGTPQIGTRRIDVGEMYVNPRVTQKMLDDSTIDVEAWLSDKASDKFSRIENGAFLGGNGIKKPRGILTYAAGTKDYQPGTIEVVKSGASGTFGANPYDTLVDLQTALKEPYQANAAFMGNRASFAALLKAKDGESRPIFNPTFDKNTGLSFTIMGQRFVFAADMAIPAADALALIYADFKRLYLIVDRMGIRTLRDPYTAKPFVSFYMTKRTGGDVVNWEAGKILKLAA